MAETIDLSPAGRTPLVSADFVPLLTRGLALGLTGLYALTALIQLLLLLGTGDLTIGMRSILGGDFIAFRASAEMVMEGRFAQVYDLSAFHAQLSGITEKESWWLMWQYPPMINFLIWPFQAGSYQTAYIAFFTIPMIMLWCVLKEMKFSAQEMFLMLASPLVVPVIMVGQISLLTTALLFTAVWFSDRKPIIAGVAAGLLTIKPQLGVLLPFAFLVAGHYRTFAVACVTALVFMGASLAVFGTESWLAFFDSVARLNDDMLDTGAGATLPDGMVTVLSQFLLLGWPVWAGQALHGLLALAAAAVVLMVWRRETSHAIRTAVICAAVPLISPYGYYYELAVLILPLALLAREGMRKGWLIGERPALVFIFVAGIGYTSFPGHDFIQYPMVMVFVVSMLVVRRFVSFSHLSPAQGHGVPRPSCP